MTQTLKNSDNGQIKGPWRSSFKASVEFGWGSLYFFSLDLNCKKKRKQTFMCTVSV